MAIIKLNPGTKVDLTIQKVEIVEGNYGKQYKFVGTTADGEAVLFLNMEPAERQFQRIGYTSPAEAVGATVEIEKVEKNGQKFTNVNKPAGARPAVQTNAKQPFTSGPHIPGLDRPVQPIPHAEYGDVPAQQAAVDKIHADKLAAMFATYERCFDKALDVASNHLPSNLITHEGVAAQAATLFIQASQRGIAA